MNRGGGRDEFVNPVRNLKEGLGPSQPIKKKRAGASLSFRKQPSNGVKAKKYAWRILSCRPRSVEEVREKLEKRGYAPDIVREAIADLSKANYLNDSEFAEWWAEARLRIKPVSLSFLEEELAGKGIAPDIINKVIGNIKGDYKEEKTAKDLALGRRRRYKTLNSRTSKRRIYSFLMRRGFSPDIIKQVLDEVYHK